MLILIILLAITSLFGLIKAVEEYEKPLPTWYRVQSERWDGFFRLAHAIARFLLTLFWIGWWVIMLGMIVFGKPEKR
ncbi:MAG: hypothetical protein ACO3BD_06490 [Chitinophagaceae bacterium]